MDKGKGVRKYGRLRQAIRRGKYILHCTALLPILFSLILLVGLICIFSFAVTIMLGIGIGLWLINGMLDTAGLCAVWLILSGAVAFASGWFLKVTFLSADESTLWNPRAPDENITLPDANLLVRASSSSAAQPAELLRAATETAEQKPEELLRLVE